MKFQSYFYIYCVSLLNEAELTKQHELKLVKTSGNSEWHKCYTCAITLRQRLRGNVALNGCSPGNFAYTTVDIIS